MTSNSLLIIPCCKTKHFGGMPASNFKDDPLKTMMSKNTYDSLVKCRSQMDINEITFERNKLMPAIDRYNGTLYKTHKNFSQIIRSRCNNKNQPYILILSALYGLLHPDSPIANYELKMNGAKKSIWSQNLYDILKNVCLTLKIDSIHIYCGSGTEYLKALKPTSEKLVSQNIVTNIIQYHVENGNSSTTPKNHGLQLLKDLGVEDVNSKFNRAIQAIKLY